ncbi:ribosomal protein L30 [Lactovum miscens]|uniref:Large ribosomal subunit protein uL30 n=1 Tax=Lactovum miscens TaxID=190387 RepID=A0A841CA73_9LACT|nr:ribosomal protein L30 [Lactovum miscens]
MAQIKITLTKSPISRIPAQRKTVVALGLGKMGSSTIKEDTAAVRAMAASISHLVTVTEVVAAEVSKAVKKTVNQKVEVSVKPTSANKVAEIKDYLDAQGISYDSSAKKADLLALVKE